MCWWLSPLSDVWQLDNILSGGGTAWIASRWTDISLKSVSIWLTRLDGEAHHACTCVYCRSMSQWLTSSCLQFCCPRDHKKGAGGSILTLVSLFFFWIAVMLHSVVHVKSDTKYLRTADQRGAGMSSCRFWKVTEIARHGHPDWFLASAKI